jgi:RNA polymerase sigma factor (TIGR02999 family)
MSQPAFSDGRAEPQSASLDGLIEPLYEQLRVLARHRLRTPGWEHSLNTTGLVHEAYLRLADSPRREHIDRSRFLGLASRVMRDVVIDHLRARGAQKRGGGWQHTLLEMEPSRSEMDLDRVLALDAALKQLASVDARQCRLIECRYFGGLSLEETASAAEVSLATAKRELRVARAWLAARLKPD